GTWWTAYNGITEYLSYERGHNGNTRLNSLWFGSNATTNKNALDLAVSLSA
ncbi:MAG: alpha/beta hydrolase, partial [Betaproteobacteria bacterium]|nr:alpha/beta hydrolase [Betaproteobacteria bacterium]